MDRCRARLDKGSLEIFESNRCPALSQDKVPDIKNKKGREVSILIKRSLQTVLNLSNREK